MNEMNVFLLSVWLFWGKCNEWASNEEDLSYQRLKEILNEAILKGISSVEDVSEFDFIDGLSWKQDFGMDYTFLFWFLCLLYTSNVHGMRALSFNSAPFGILICLYKEAAKAAIFYTKKENIPCRSLVK